MTVASASVLLVERRPDPVACEEEAEHTGWTQARRSAIRHRFETSTAPFADESWERVEAAFDRHAAAWTDAFGRACEMSDPDQSDRVVRCLRRQRASGEALLDVLGSATSKSLGAARGQVAALDAPKRCFDDAGSGGALPIPSDPELAADVDDTRVLIDRARAYGPDAEAGLDDAERALGRARELGYAPLVAEAQHRVAALQSILGRDAEAAAGYEKAYYIALGAHHDSIAAAAAMNLVHINCLRALDLDAASRWLAASAAAIERLPEDHDRRIEHLDAEGALAEAEGRYDDARATRKRWLEQLESRFGGRSQEVAHGLLRVARDLFNVGDKAAVGPLLHRALSIYEELEGPEHPDTGWAHHYLCGYYVEMDITRAEQPCSPVGRRTATDAAAPTPMAATMSPIRASYSATQKLKMSARASTFSPRYCSGAM